MPLSKECSKAALSANIAELIRSGKPEKQATAIAYDTYRKACGKKDSRVEADAAVLASVVAELGLQVRVDDLLSETVVRFDLSRLGKAKRTPQGFLKFDANLTRVGVLKYRRADGTVQREFRPPEEVFNEDSLASLAGAPLTDGHVAMVTPKNVREVRIGRVADAVKHDDRFVQSVVTVEDQGTIDKVDRGERKELSAGYRCRLDFTPGTFDGEPYDAIQRGIEYNHVAIGPEGWGRAGSEVALRLDGDAAASLDNDVSDVIHQGVNHSAGGGGGQADEPKAGASTMKRNLRIDGVDYEVEANESMFQAFDRWTSKRDEAAAELKTRLDAAEKKYAEDMAFVSAWHDGLQGRFDAQSRDLQKAQTDLVEANKPERLDKLVNDRVEIVSKARKVLGDEEKLDGLTDRQIKEKALQKLDAEAKFDGKADAYVDGMFDQAVANLQPARREDGAGAARRAGTPPPPKEGDEKPKTATEARADFIKREEEAWRPKERDNA